MFYFFNLRWEGEQFMTSLTKLQLTDLNNRRTPYLETIFSLANGHFGIRASNPIEPSFTAGTLVNGFFESNPITYGESAYGYAKNHQTIVNLPDLRAVEVFDDAGQRFDHAQLTNSQLDFETGVLKQSYLLSNDDPKTIKMTLTSVVDQNKQHLAGLRYEFFADSYQGTIDVSKPLMFSQSTDISDDPRKARQITSLDLSTVVDEADQKEILVKTQQSGLTVSLKVKAVDGILDNWHFNLAEDEAVATYLAGVSSIYQADDTPEINLEQDSFLEVENDAHAYWQKVWRNSQIEIDGDDQLTQAIRYNIFQLNQSAGRDGKTNIAAKGLSGTGYEGHYFWDTEMYLLPYFTYTNPEIAQKLLDFRFNTLDSAKKQARTLGVNQGALFPWRTINGEEASAYYPAGTAQYHIDGDIAYAVNRYFEATNDTDWLIAKGYELILETARFWANFGHYRIEDDQERFEFSGVTGPNEYTVMVDNNYYTNRIAKHNLNLAVRLAVILKQLAPEKLTELDVNQDELNKFALIAQSIYLPYDERYQINAQDDSFLSKPLWPFDSTPKENYPLLLHYHPLTIYRYQVAKQADTILAEFLFPQDTSQKQLAREYKYYEKITTHDSSLSRSVFSMVAARLGDEKQAYNYFMTTAKMDLVDLQGNTEDGLHLSNLGGSWLALTAGFAGMTFEEGKFHLINHLPKEWKALNFRIRLRDNLFFISLTRLGIDVELLEGPETKVEIDGHWQTISRPARFEQIANS